MTINLPKDAQIASLTAQLAQTQDQLREAQALLKEMSEKFERVADSGVETATIIEKVVTDKKMYAVMSNGMYITDVDGYAVGETAVVFPKTGQILDKVPNPEFGTIAVIEKITDSTFTIQGKIIPRNFNLEVDEGDTVLMDRHSAFALKVIQKAQKELNIEVVYWDQIGGQEEAKELLREAIELPYLHPKLYAAYGKKVTKGGVLYGPPGCGKTMLGRAVATAVGSPEGFISIKGPEVLSTYVGASEAHIRALFNRAKTHKAKTGKPAVIFIDEAEALLTHRSDKNNFMGQTIVPQFLTEMDGLETSAAIVLLSTNRLDMLDPAIIRDGRVDFKVEIKRPDIKDAVSIFDIHMGGRPIMPGHERVNLIKFAVTTLFGHTKVPHSGALIAGCVDKAITHALRRDIKKNKVSGLCEADFTWAIDQVAKEAA